MNFEKYRELDTIKLHGISADIFQENEHGELIDPLRGKDADWLTGKSTLAKAENFNFEQFVLNEINQHFINNLEAKDICICGSCFSFWKQEDDDGLEDDNGKYFVSYAVSITINGKYIDEEDLYELFPDFEY